VTLRIQITPKALKQIAKLDKPTRVRIERFLTEGLDRENPRSSGRPLVERSFWRYRVGDYRVLATIEDDVLIVLVVTVAHRREAYREP
jgi:mRNA interferase RelE/StbE